MLYIYLPLLYYHGNIYVTEGAYAGGVFRCPSGLSCFDLPEFSPQVIPCLRNSETCNDL